MEIIRGLSATANPVELIWLAIGLVTGGINATLWILATRDLLAVYRLRQNGAKRIEARTWFWAHGLLVVAQCVAVGIGLFLVFTPPANPSAPLTTAGVVVASGLIVKQLINATIGVFLILRRGQLDHYLDGERHAAGVPVGALIERVTVQEAVDLVAHQQDEAEAKRLAAQADAARDGDGA